MHLLCLEPLNIMGKCACWPTSLPRRTCKLLNWCAWWPRSLRAKNVAVLTARHDAWQGGHLNIICSWLLWDPLEFDILVYNGCACATSNVFFVCKGSATAILFFIYDHIDTYFDGSIPSHGDISGDHLGLGMDWWWIQSVTFLSHPRTSGHRTSWTFVIRLVWSRRRRDTDHHLIHMVAYSGKPPGSRISPLRRSPVTCWSWSLLQSAFAGRNRVGVRAWTVWRRGALDERFRKTQGGAVSGFYQMVPITTQGEIVEGYPRATSFGASTRHSSRGR